MSELRPCPFCGGTNLKSGGDDKVVGTWCLTCEASGPNQYGQHEWNDRAQAAPDMLEALKDALELLERHYPKPARNGQIARARAAIAKAEGRS